KSNPRSTNSRIVNVLTANRSLRPILSTFVPSRTIPVACSTGGISSGGARTATMRSATGFPWIDGGPLLVAPCSQEPLDYFVWDPETGAIGLIPDPRRRSRAKQTRDLFRLDQESFREERRCKYLMVRYLLARVVQEDPVSEQTQDRLHDELR